MLHFHSKLLLDNSTSFTSSRTKDLCQKWKVKLIFGGAWNSLMAWPDWSRPRPRPLILRQIYATAISTLKALRCRVLTSNCFTNLAKRVQTVFRGADLYSRRAGALSTGGGPRRDPDVVDGVGREVVQPVGVDRRRDGDSDVLPEMRIVVVKLVRVHGDAGGRAVPSSGLVPGQLDRRGRYRLALEVRRLFRHYIRYTQSTRKIKDEMYERRYVMDWINNRGRYRQWKDTTLE